MAKRSKRAMRNLSSAGMSSAKFTGRTAGKAAVGVFRRFTKGHVRCLPADCICIFQAAAYHPGADIQNTDNDWLDWPNRGQSTFSLDCLLMALSRLYRVLIFCRFSTQP